MTSEREGHFLWLSEALTRFKATEAEVRAHCESGKIAELPGFGAKTQSKIVEAIALHETFSGVFLLGPITALAEGVVFEGGGFAGGPGDFSEAGEDVPFVAAGAVRS